MPESASKQDDDEAAAAIKRGHVDPPTKKAGMMKRVWTALALDVPTVLMMLKYGMPISYQR